MIFFASKITSEIHPYDGIYEFIDLEVCMWIHTFKQNWMKIYEFINPKVWIHRIIVRNQWIYTPRRPMNSYFYMYDIIYFHLIFFCILWIHRSRDDRNLWIHRFHCNNSDPALTEIYEFIDYVTILRQRGNQDGNLFQTCDFWGKKNGPWSPGM